MEELTITKEDLAKCQMMDKIFNEALELLSTKKHSECYTPEQRKEYDEEWKKQFRFIMDLIHEYPQLDAYYKEGVKSGK